MKIQQIADKYLPKYKVSIAVWVSLNTTKGVHNIFTTESSEGNIGYRLQVVRGRIRWAIGTDTVPVIFDNMTKSDVVPEALWTHIIATYNNENGVTKIYANSMLKFNDIVPEERRVPLPTNWDNDASIGDHTFRGFLDEFILYNWELDDSEALYVRNYCADHPKLVRFTVRVPLTKKTVVPHTIAKNKQENNKKRSLIPHPSSARSWYIYMTLLNQKLARERNTLQKPVNFPITQRYSGIPYSRQYIDKTKRRQIANEKKLKAAILRKKAIVAKTMRELAENPSDAFTLLKR